MKQNPGQRCRHPLLTELSIEKNRRSPRRSPSPLHPLHIYLPLLLPITTPLNTQLHPSLIMPLTDPSSNSAYPTPKPLTMQQARRIRLARQHVDDNGAPPQAGLQPRSPSPSLGVHNTDDKNPDKNSNARPAHNWQNHVTPPSGASALSTSLASLMARTTTATTTTATDSPAYSHFHEELRRCRRRDVEIF